MRSVGEAMVRLFGLSLALAFVASASGCGLSLLVGGIAASASGGSSSSTVATVPAPEVTAISPATASHMGGMSATITGSNFPTDGVSLPTVTVGGTAATSVQVIDANTLTIVLPSASTVGPVDVAVTNPAGGTGTLGGGLTWTNDLPEGTVTPLATTQSQNLVFSVVLRDPESDRIDLKLEYRANGQAYQDIPADQILSGGTTGLASSPSGVTHNLTWNTSVLFSAQNANDVQIRVTPIDTIDSQPGTPVESNVFSIANNIAPTLEVSAPARDSFEVALAYRAADANPGASLTLSSATWRDVNSGASGNLTIKSGSPSSVPGSVPSSVSGTNLNLVWDSFADLGFGNNRLVEVTLTLSDGTSTTTARTGNFFVSNGPLTDAVIAPGNLGQVKGFASGDLNGDGKIDAVLSSDLLRSYALLLSDGQAFQSPVTKTLLGRALPVATQIAWNGTTTLNVTGSTSPVAVGDWLGLPRSFGGAPLGDPIGPRFFRVSAIGANTITIEDPDNYAGSGLLPGSAALGGAVAATANLTLRLSGQAGVSATSLPNDFRPGQLAVLSCDEDLSTVASPTSDLVIANELPPQITSSVTAVAGAVFTLQSLSPFSPLSGEAFEVGMQVLISQGATTEQGKIQSVDAANNRITLTAAPANAFTAGAFVTGLTSSSYSLGAGHQRNHSIVVLPQTGGAIGTPAQLIQTGGVRPTDLIAVDIASNGGGPDGKQDLVVVHAATTTATSTRGAVSILLRRAAGAYFEAPITIPVGTGGANPAFSLHATVADVTSNGLLDVIVANAVERSVSIITQGPAGTFNAATNIDLSSFGIPQGDVQSVAVGDFNEDGLPDLACGGAFSQRIIVLRGADPDGAGPQVSFPGANMGSPTLSMRQSPAPPALVAGAASMQPAATLYTGVGTARYVAQDVNGDGRVDLSVTEGVQNRITIYVNKGTSGGVTTFDAVRFSTSLNPFDLEVGDVSGDGRADVLVSGSTLADVSRLQALVPGTLDRPLSFPVGTSPQSLTAGELDSSTPGLELVVGNSGDTSISILARDGAGGLKALFPSGGSSEIGVEIQDKSLLSPTPGVGSLRLVSASGVGIGDHNNDGRNDVVVFTQSSTESRGGAAVLLNQGGAAPIQTTTRVVLSSSTVFGGYVGQIVGDAHPDLVLVELSGATTGTLRVFRGGANATFATDVSFTMALPSSATLSDLDGDGDLDVLVPLNTAVPPNFQIILQGPAGTLGAPQDGVTGGIQLPGFTGASYAIAADLNNDGLKDVAFTNFVGSLVGVAFQNKPAQVPPKFDTVVSLLTLLQPAEIVAGDLNGDGLDDLAITYAGSNQVGVYYQNSGANKAGAQSLAGPIFLSTSPSPFACEILDVDGDGKQDLVTSSRAANVVEVFYQR